MKRKLMIALLFVGALSLAACGGEDPATDAGTDQGTGATDESGTTNGDASDGDATDDNASNGDASATDTDAGTDETLVARTYEIGIDGMT